MRNKIIFSIITTLFIGVVLYAIYFQLNGATLTTTNEQYLHEIPDVTIDPTRPHF